MTIGRTCWIDEPLVGCFDDAASTDDGPVRKLEQASVQAVGRGSPSHRPSETCCAFNFSGSTCTCIIWRRSPQIATFATPGTRSRRSLIVQYEIIDISVSDLVSDVSPIFITRLVADSG